MKAQKRIEMTRKMLMSISLYHFNESKLVEICTNNEYIPEGSFVMSNGDENVYFENNVFITKKNGIEIKKIEKSQLNEIQQEQLFCIWAGKNC